MEMACSFFRHMTRSKETDWEQRRYEIAKDTLANMVANTSFDANIEYLTSTSVHIADALIDELRK